MSKKKNDERIERKTLLEIRKNVEKKGWGRERWKKEERDMKERGEMIEKKKQKGQWRGKREKMKSDKNGRENEESGDRIMIIKVGYGYKRKGMKTIQSLFFSMQ